MLAMTANAVAQQPVPEPPPTPQQAPSVTTDPTATKARVDTLLVGITLSEEQQPKVDSIVAQYAKELPAALPDSASDPMGRERIMALIDRMDTEIRAVLTEEQQKVFDKNKEEWRRRSGVGS
jgi:Spy/CpxP family protein refolding chaperone